MLCGYFGEGIPEETEDKKAFLLRRGIALWDTVVSCEIEGSADSSVKNPEIADLKALLGNTKIKKILLNGTLAYRLFLTAYENIGVPYEKMPSTSPANPRYDEAVWRRALDEVF